MPKLRRTIEYRGKYPVTTGGAGYIPENNGVKAVKDAVYNYVTGGLPIQEVRQRLYNNIVPAGYGDAISRVRNAVVNNKKEDNGEFRNYITDRYRKNLWAEYLQIPKNKREYAFYDVENSPYRPTIADNKKIKYKRITPGNNLGIPSRMWWNVYNELADKKERQSELSWALGDFFGTHTISRGHEKGKGSYISYYDVWDLSPFRRHGHDESRGIGKPVYLYDRAYLDDLFHIEDKDKGAYWLPEITIRGNRKTKALGGKVKSSFVRGLETQPTILEQVAEYNKEPKNTKTTENKYQFYFDKHKPLQQRIKEQKAANQRERNIAKHYLAAGPNIVNLAKAAYHWYNSVPYLGGELEDGMKMITGTVDVPGMRNPKSIIKGVSATTKAITKANAAKVTPAQWTAAQDAAIARGDIAEAQRLRDLHFMTKAPNTVIKNVDGTPAHVYHGTFNKGWNSYDKRKFGTSTDNGMYGEGLYATSDRSYADVYARGNNADGKYIGEIKDLYVNGENPFYVFNKKDLSPKEIVNREDAAYQFGRTLKVQDDIPTPIWDEMNNSDIVIETKGTKRPNFAEIVVPRGEQIKLADAITYDDKGVRIPLGDRDNFNINDIRYAIAPILAGGIGYGAYRNQKASGGSIHIAPSKRGTFTAAASKHGMGVQEFANRVLANKENYSPAMVKKANFARNASKWKH